MTKQSACVSLVIPGLLGPQKQYPQLELHERPELKNITRLLSRATPAEYPDTDWLSVTSRLLLPNLNSRQIPFAAISAEVDCMADALNIDAVDDNVDKPAWCMRIDPVHLRIDMDSAIMLAADELQLSEAETNALTESINQHLKQDGIKIHVAHPHRWYLFFDAPRTLNTTPLHQVMGNDVNELLPEGDEAMYWRSLLNELQMLLYTHPVNQQREQRGLAAVNSVWFWGEGLVPQKNTSDWQGIYTDNDQVEMLAAFCGIPCYELNQYKASEVNGHVMVVVTELQSLVHNQDIFAWINALTTLDTTLFKMVREALKIKRMELFSVFPCNQQKFELTQKQSAKWWKRSKKIADFF